MEDLIKQSNIGTIIEFCMDIASAIWEKSRDHLIFKYSELVQIGQIAYFLQALIREKKNNVIDIKLVQRLATKYGIFQIDSLITSYTKKDGKAKISMNDEGNLVVGFSSYKEMMEICYNICINKEKKGLFNDKYHINLILILISAIIPKKIDYFNKIIKDTNILKEILEDSLTLGLLIYDSGYYYSPKLFKSLNKETLNILTDFNLASYDIIKEIEKIQKNPAYPIENLDERIQKATIEGAFKGILVPIPVKLPEEPSKYFVFADPQDLESGDLSYETAAYFRFNEVYALTKYGRLEKPILFLNKLIDKGIAGNATNIGINYFPLEIKGVIKVVEGTTTSKKRMVSLKPGVLKEARGVLTNEFGSKLGNIKKPPSWLTDPAGFRAFFSNSEFVKNNLFKLKKLLRDM